MSVRIRKEELRVLAIPSGRARRTGSDPGKVSGWAFGESVGGC